MLKRECVQNQGVLECQIPYTQEGISGITHFLGLIFIIVFSGIAFFKLLHAFFK